MPVEFLSDEEAAAYGRFGGPQSRAELERVFFIDDADRALICRHRGEHNRLGFALQLTTVRSLGLFLADPLDVPGVVLDYLASQLEIDDASCVARYVERRTTRFEHARGGLALAAEQKCRRSVSGTRAQTTIVQAPHEVYREFVRKAGLRSPRRRRSALSDCVVAVA